MSLIPGSGRSPGEGNGNPLQYFCWRISGTEEPGKLQSMGSQGVGHDWATNILHFYYIASRVQWPQVPQLHWPASKVFLPWWLCNSKTVRNIMFLDIIFLPPTLCNICQRHKMKTYIFHSIVTIVKVKTSTIYSYRDSLSRMCLLYWLKANMAFRIRVKGYLDIRRLLWFNLSWPIFLYYFLKSSVVTLVSEVIKLRGKG